MGSTRVNDLVPEADHRRRSATTQLDQSKRGDLGQFLTPAGIARLMASLFEPLPDQIRLLDAGAGVGGLTAAFVAESVARPKKPATISATAFELDRILIPHLRETLTHCNSSCTAEGVAFKAEILAVDFVDTAVEALSGSLFAGRELSFNAAILNPPYRKIGTFSRERKLVQRVGLDATNLYAAFVALAVRLLSPDGQLVAIIPRSFCNGPYFRCFRDVLLAETEVLRIHVFESRKDAFKDDSVLQENVIIHVKKSTAKRSRIVVSSGGGPTEAVRLRSLAYDDVVRASNGDWFIHLPTDDGDGVLAKWMCTLPDTLKSLGLSVSTGRVVDFRARAFLRATPEHGAVPLVYPCHLAVGEVRWPKLDSKKPNALVDSGETQALLVPQGFYTLTKRFSAKEERRRLVAAVYDPEVIRAPCVAFENHLNYFHREGAGLSRDEAYGLAAFLNSEPIDRYFRQFNGHTQVNATDLRSLRYPSRSSLCELGKQNLVPGSQRLEEAVLVLYPLPS